jgi:outer membrane protein assembly factor BamB
VDALNERIYAVDQIASTVMGFGVNGSNGPFWQYKIQEIGGEYQPLSSPAPWGDVVFVTKYKTLYALKANPRKYLGPGDKVGPPPIKGVDQGIVLWSADLPERIQANGSPAISTGTDPCVVVVGATGMVVKAHAAFNPPDGKRNIWTNSINAHVFKPAAIGSEGRIFIPANNGRMYCMDSDGKLLWSAPPAPHNPHEPFPVENTSAPAIGLQNGNDLVYFTVRQQLFAISGLTGATVWSLALDQLPASDPVVTPNQTIYLGVGSEERGQVIAVRAKPKPLVAGGGVAMVPEIVWSASIGSRPNYLAVGDNGFIYVSTDLTLFRIE